MKTKQKKIATNNGFTVVLREIAVLREVQAEYAPPSSPMNSPVAVASMLREYLSDKDDVEHMIVIPLDTQNYPIGIHLVGKGTLNEITTAPREVFRSCVISNANAVIIAHNHPSGNLTPSNADINITNQLVEAGRILGIRVLDHLIFTLKSEEYYSFAEHKLT